MTGYVYIASNPALKEDYVKIGRTDDPDVLKRIEALASTGVPKPFDIVAVFACEDSERLEHTLHTVFGDRRVADNREFFLLDKGTIELARTLLSASSTDLTEFFEVRLRRERDDEVDKGTSSSNRNAPGDDDGGPPQAVSGKLAPEKDRAIKADLVAGKSQRQTAKDHGVSWSAVHRRFEQLRKAGELVLS